MLVSILTIWSIYSASTIRITEARKVPDIYWNSTNPIFDISNTDHVISVRIGDRVSIKCPKSTSSSLYEYSYIYMVSDEEYTHCFLHNPRLIGSCDNETQESSVNIVFRSFTPTPGGFEFQPGKTYYLITTSDGTVDGIDRKKDGLCASHQMKIKFVVGVENRKGEESPKFAARTYKKERDSEDSTQIMYVIHNGNEDDAEDDPQDDDDGSNSCSYNVSLLLLLTFWFF